MESKLYQKERFWWSVGYTCLIRLFLLIKQLKESLARWTVKKQDFQIKISCSSTIHIVSNHLWLSY